MKRDAIGVTVYGADKLTEQLNEIDSLVVMLRRKLAELQEDSLRLEVHLNQSSDVFGEGSNDVTK